jgi:hypothetical protein
VSALDPVGPVEGSRRVQPAWRIDRRKRDEQQDPPPKRQRRERPPEPGDDTPHVDVRA